MPLVDRAALDAGAEGAREQRRDRLAALLPAWVCEDLDLLAAADLGLLDKIVAMLLAGTWDAGAYRGLTPDELGECLPDIPPRLRALSCATLVRLGYATVQEGRYVPAGRGR